MKSFARAMIAAALIVSAAAAQTTTSNTVTGTVVSATPDALVINTDSGQIAQMTFKLDAMLDRTRYDTLKPGDHIQILHKTTDDGLEVVTAISPLQEPSAGASTPAGDNTTAAATDNSSRATNTNSNGASASLPATASATYVLALLSALAIAGGMGLAVRAYRSLNRG